MAGGQGWGKGRRNRERDGMDVECRKGIEIVKSGSCHFFLYTFEKGPGLASSASSHTLSGL